MNIFQILAICGMLSPIIYTLMWIIIGTMQKGYSHIEKDISSLYAMGAPYKHIFQPFMIISNVLSLALYIGLHEGINDGEGSIVGPILFIISGSLGLIVSIFFPLDEGGEIKTYKGKGHLTLIVLSGIFAIAGMIALWLRLRFVENLRGFAIYSLISAVLSIILVIFSGKYAGSNYMGLVERFMVSSYEIYYFVISLMVFLNN